MPKPTYYQKRKKTHTRLVVDIKNSLYRAFRKSKHRKDAATDSEGLRRLLIDTLHQEQ